MSNAHNPPPKTWRERIGDKELSLTEERLDVFDQVALWSGNPRLLPQSTGSLHSDEQLEAHLQQTKGYDVLRKSIADLGQMEPIYAWRQNGGNKYLVLEGATRVTILRELARRNGDSSPDDRFRYVTAKLLPADFSPMDRTILLAKIHVRGTGVRSWGRYVEAKFVHDSVATIDGKAPIMTVTQLANHMGKSISWVTRLKDAYSFARHFVDYIDAGDAEAMAVNNFSTLEEISKSTGFGPMVRDYENDEHRGLREDVFEMVRNDVFKEYRDARFMRQFYDDPEKWQQLKTHQKHIANSLATEEKRGAGTLSTRIAALPDQIARALRRDKEAVTEDSLEALTEASRVLAEHLSGSVAFRLHLREFTRALEEVTLSDIKAITSQEYEDFQSGVHDFEIRLEKNKQWS